MRAGLVAIVLLISAVARAQTGDQPNTLRLQTRLVSIAAYIRDKQGRPAGGLTRDDFTLKQDGTPQEIRFFSQGSDQPLTLSLLVDTSGSQRRLIPDETAAAMIFFRAMLARPQDRASLVQFAGNVRELAPLTPDVDNLQRGLGYLDYNAPSPVGTLLFDAICAVAPRLATESGRKAMILLTDGGDNGSRSTLMQAIAAAQKADTVIYAIYYSEDERFGHFSNTRPTGDRGALEKLATETGGQVFDAGPRAPLRDLFARIEDQLRLEYLLAYRPSDAVAGTYHKLELKAKDKNLQVSARKGFYTP